MNREFSAWSLIVVAIILGSLTAASIGGCRPNVASEADFEFEPERVREVVQSQMTAPRMRDPKPFPNNFEQSGKIKRVRSRRRPAPPQSRMVPQAANRFARGNTTLGGNVTFGGNTTFGARSPWGRGNTTMGGNTTFGARSPWGSSRGN
ncbi:MAG: hypothetical protein AAFP90_12740, partial [Planctomycetota bacterium]